MRVISTAIPEVELNRSSLILSRGARRTNLLADEQPEAAGRPVHPVPAHRVEVARAFRPCGDPAGVGQRFEVPADGRLRQLHNAAKLGHGQFVPVEQQENAAARGVSQRRQVVEDCRAAISTGGDLERSEAWW